MHLYAQDHLPEGEAMTHTLNVKDADHQRIILRQKCLRLGPGNYMGACHLNRP